MNGLKWFPFNRGDYLRAVSGWPPMARLAYLELLAAQWDHGKLPPRREDVRVLVAGVTAKQWARVWPLVAREFPVNGDSRQNPALESLRERQTATRKSRSKAASAAARARWQARTGVEPDA
jgi:uncharacterized protein YdaU (DUF1376 family)